MVQIDCTEAKKINIRKLSSDKGIIGPVIKVSTIERCFSKTNQCLIKNSKFLCL